MRAINLIPAEERRARAGAGRSDGLVYVLLGTLAMLTVLAAVYGMTTKAAHDKQAELADTTARAAAAERTAASLVGYADFSTVRRQRAEAVKGLAAKRVDWAHVLHEVARTVPSNAWLTSMHAKSGGATPSAAGTTLSNGTTPSTAATSSAVSATTAPSIDLTGCTTGQRAVPALMAELRRIDGVADVSLASSTKGGSGSGAAASSPASSTAAGASGSGGGPCSKPGRTTFAMTLSFRAQAASAGSAATATTGSTP
jgi:Tfp pilus assembly protein PilN